MRLTCPNCAATYEVEMRLIPAAGGHVQCTACHTRWFERPAPQAERPSEDQILSRLESRAQRPRLAAVAGASSRGAAPSTIAFPSPRAARSTASTSGAVSDARPLAAALPVAPAPAASTPLRPRLGAEAPPPAAAPRSLVPVGPRSGFGPGFALALALACVALAAYLRAVPMAQRVPALTPALEVYASQVDAARDATEARLGPWRDRLTRRDARAN